MAQDPTATLTWLRASGPWMKRFDEEGRSTQRFYARFTSYTDPLPGDPVEGTQALHESFLSHARDRHAWLRGSLTAPLVNEPRAGKTSRRHLSPVLAVDVDGVEAPVMTSTGLADPARFAHEVLRLPQTWPFHFHYSSSYGITKGLEILRGLYVFLLDRPMPWDALRRWLVGRNLYCPEIRAGLEPDAGMRTLVLPIDPAAASPHQLFTVATPQVPKKFKKGPLKALFLHPDARHVLYIPPEPTLPTPRDLEVDREELHRLLSETTNEVLASAGVRHPKRSPEVPPTLTPVRDPDTGREWVDVPDPLPSQEVMDEFHESGPVVRFNTMDPKDLTPTGTKRSWWFLKDNPRYVYDWRSGCRYPFRRLFPQILSAWEERQKASIDESLEEREKAVEEGNRVPFVALLHPSEQFLCVIEEANSTWLDAKVFTKVSSVKSWLKTHGLTAPYDGHPPVYDVVFDPEAPFLDHKRRRVNRFVRPPLVLDDPDVPLSDLLRRLVIHVHGGDDVTAERFLDAAAYLFQTGRAPQAAFIWHGTTGTGKDTLYNYLRRAFGAHHCKKVAPNVLRETYNAWAEDTMIVFVNEIESKVFRGTNLSSRLNDWITGETIQIRRMRADPYEVSNHLLFIFASNRADVIELPPHDRRYHVPPRQEGKLRGAVSETELQTLVAYPDELVYNLRNHLAHREYDLRFMQPEDTEAKRAIAQASQDTGEWVTNLLLRGDWMQIVVMLNEALTVMGPLSDATSVIELLESIRAQTKQPGGEVLLSISQMMILYNVLLDGRVGNNRGAGRFGQYVSHKGLPRPQVRPTGMYFPFSGPTEDTWAPLHEALDHALGSSKDAAKSTDEHRLTH